MKSICSPSARKPIFAAWKGAGFPSRGSNRNNARPPCSRPGRAGNLPMADLAGTPAVPNPSGPREFAAAIIVNRSGELLLLRRSTSSMRWPGKWGIAGGGMEAGETSEQGLRRELREELGEDIRMRTLARTRYLESHWRVRRLHSSLAHAVGRWNHPAQRGAYRVCLGGPGRLCPPGRDARSRRGFDPFRDLARTCGTARLTIFSLREGKR